MIIKSAVLIELTAKEAPVMDGSAKDFVDALGSVNFIEQKKDRHVLDISKPVVYSDLKKEIDIHVVPADRFRVTFLVEYPLPALGTQYEAIYNMEEDFAVEVAPARTFCILSEIEMFNEQGLIQGGSLENALVCFFKKMATKHSPLYGEMKEWQNYFTQIVSSLIFTYRQLDMESEAESILTDWLSKNPDDPVAKKLLEDLK